MAFLSCRHTQKKKIRKCVYDSLWHLINNNTGHDQQKRNLSNDPKITSEKVMIEPYCYHDTKESLKHFDHGISKPQEQRNE